MAPAPRPVARFAPSPTGMLHIGGARTALFNWLFARHNGGEFHLRIEDTDRQRSTDEARAAILNGLKWLELDWDGEVVYQSQRLDRHREVAQMLLAKGAAYRCFCTPEDLTAMREAARAAGRPVRYDGRWRDRDPADAPPGIEPVIRIKAPLTGAMTIHDIVQGDVRIEHEQLDDFILLRSDGSPTYMLSVVVDDRDMKVTDIIRGDDHLTNAFRQKIIYDALDWSVPAFAHIPLIHGPDGSKLSKRHGALAVEAYRDMGYLPAAMRNYLLRLGWSHGDDEIISTEQAIDWFNLEAIGRGPARFDIAKLNFLNGHYLRQMDDDRLASEVYRMLTAKPGIELGETARSRLGAAMGLLKQRAKTLVELIENCQFLVARRPLTVSDSARQQLDAQARVLLAELARDLALADPWTAEALEQRVRAFVDSKGLKLGQVAQPLRAALTGSTSSPGLFDVLAILGREDSLARIGDQATSAIQ